MQAAHPHRPTGARGRALGARRRLERGSKRRVWGGARKGVLGVWYMLDGNVLTESTILSQALHSCGSRHLGLGTLFWFKERPRRHDNRLFD